MRKLWYDKPAKIWNDALPIGNGRIGAMVFGEALFDRVQINEETLWSGYPKKDDTVYDAEFINELRSLVNERKYLDAESKIKGVLCGAETAAYVPYGFLNIDILSEKDEVCNYRRELNLENAVTTTTFTLGENAIEKTAFVSLADDIMVYRIKSSRPVTVRVTSACELQHTLTTTDGVMQSVGRCPTYVSSYTRTFEYDENKESIPFCSMLKPVTINGDMTVYGGSSLRIYGTDFMLVFSIKTGFNGHDKMPISQSKEYKRACFDCLDKACALSYQDLLERHEREYKKYFDRVSITLEGEDYDEPTNERIKKAGEGRVDNKLVTLLFDFSRFLAICSNGIGSEVTNLQGIWNDDITPLWRCNYTININTQMNYWTVNACDLPELHLPLFKMLRDLKEKGNRFGLRGWSAFHNTDIWRDNTVKSKYPAASWEVTNPAWLCRHIWEHYAHTRDLKFLEDNYDILTSQAEFLLDYMVEDEDGELIVSPSAAPENLFMFEGQKCSISKWTSYDQGICIDFFDKLVKISEILNKDSSLYRDTLNKIKRVPIASDGRVIEWNEEFEESEVGHRHISHLYGFYPADIFPSDKYASAVEKSVAMRVQNSSTDFQCGQIGWSCAWIGSVYAKLGKGEKVMEQLRTFFKNCSLSNLLAICLIFQIEANFGIAATILDALVQSNENEVKLLPALPKEWKHGEVKGLVVRTGEKIDFKW